MTILVETIEETRRRIASVRAGGRIVGFVPTMGALHAGHSALMERCRAESDFVVASIFVNPTQFAPGEDLDRYPRTLELDLDRCRNVGVDLVFYPSIPEIYPNGSDSTLVETPGLTRILEGAARPGHFRGVATVVLKLFNIVQPDIAYFGQKDFQQLTVIRRMTTDLLLPVEIRPHPTVREPDGLALSSRNRYLSARERSTAPILHRALTRARDAVVAGLANGDRVRQILRETLESGTGVVVDYAEVVDDRTLEPLTELTGRRAIALVAARLGSTRLLDNLYLSE